ncbi:MAG: hypothetical protein U9N34_05115 [Candidatus Cloacimonadota bacterium]|nr:hypothetical protein [Candidatus Cloacimonadota bacterium]
MFVNHLLEKYDNIEELIYEGFLGNLDVEINKIKLHLANGRKTFAMVF